MKRIALRWLGALLLSITLAAPALAAGKHLINGIDANYPPFAYVDETGKPAGFDVDSMNWIAKKMGFTVEHKPMDWDGIIPALLAKKIDMVCSGMSISRTQGAGELLRSLLDHPQDFHHQEGLQGHRRPDLTTAISNSASSAAPTRHEMLQKAQAEKKYNYQLRFYDSGPMAIEDLLNGRIDAIGLDAAPAEDAMRKGKPVQEVGVFGSDEFGVAIRKDDAETMKLVNEGYKLLKADPYWKELQAKYLGNKQRHAHAGGRTAPAPPTRLRKYWPATSPSAVAASLSGPPCFREDWRTPARFAVECGRGLRGSALDPPVPGRAEPSERAPRRACFLLKGADASKSIVQRGKQSFRRQWTRALRARRTTAFGVPGPPQFGNALTLDPPFRESRCWK